MQQVNLYQATLRKPREVLSWSHLRVAAVAVIGICMGISGVQLWLGYRQQQQLNVVMQEQQQRMNEIQVLQQELAALSMQNDSKMIQDELTLRDTELQNKQKILTLLSDKHFGNTKGFSDHFKGLARQHVEGLWLTGLAIREGGEQLDIQGSALQPDLLPQFLQRLNKEASFSGIEFKTFVMQRSKDGRQINFDMRAMP